MSERVGECLRCGHCCRAIFLNFGMGDAPTQDDKDAADDFLRWASFHKNVTITYLSESVAEVGYQTPCEHLSFDEHQRAECALYEDRPRICKRYPDSPNPNCPGFKFIEEESEEKAK